MFFLGINGDSGGKGIDIDPLFEFRLEDSGTVEICGQIPCRVMLSGSLAT